MKAEALIDSLYPVSQGLEHTAHTSHSVSFVEWLIEWMNDMNASLSSLLQGEVLVFPKVPRKQITVFMKQMQLGLP